VTVREFIRAVRDTWRRTSERSESEVIDEFAGFDILVVDEIGVQVGTENEQNILFELLDTRYRAMRPTLLVSNENTEGLRAFLGERLIDRVREGGRIIPMSWPSWRGSARYVPNRDSGTGLTVSGLRSAPTPPSTATRPRP
jgi:DNA replication protein DnaC